jgi:hypothetical protein
MELITSIDDLLQVHVAGGNGAALDWLSDPSISLWRSATIHLCIHLNALVTLEL